MKQLIFLLVFSMAVFFAKAQIMADTSSYAEVTIIKDKRIDVLGQKMEAYNVALSKNILSGKGYRLMLISTNDRILAMQLRSTLMQYYPDHKVYMLYQVPFIKIKMGNFVEKDEAEKVKKMLLAQRIVTNNIYILPETIELKPEPLAEQEQRL